MGVKPIQTKRGRRYEVRWTLESGKEAKKLMPRGTTKEEADRFLRDVKTRVDRIKAGLEVRDRNPHGLTLGEVAKRWLKTQDERVTNAVTNHIINTPLGALRIEKVTPEVVSEHLDNLQPRPPTKGRKARTQPLSPRTRNHVRKHLVQVFGFAIKGGLLVAVANPAQAVKARKVKRQLLDTYTAAECARLVNAVAQPWRGILAMALHGLRKGEVWGLDVADVDLERGELRVRRSHDEDLTKNGRERVVPIIASLRAAITEAMDLARGRSVPLFPGRDPKARPGAMQTKRRHDRASMSVAFGRAQRLAKLHRIRFHDLRHTTATLLLQAGAPIERVSKILGHSSVAITADLYGHLITRDLHDAMGRLSFDLPAPRAVVK